MSNPLFRAIAGFTDAKTGLPMGDISRVKVFAVDLDYDDEITGIKEGTGDLFVDSCGIAQYFPSEEESLMIRFEGKDTAEQVVDCLATYQGN